LGLSFVTACGDDENGSPSSSPDAGAPKFDSGPDSTGVPDANGGDTGGSSDGGLAALRIELSPPGMILQPGGSSVVTAKVVDAAGTPVPAGQLTWEKKGSAVTLTEGA